jgi:pilus assembly protein Flp/PilA
VRTLLIRFRRDDSGATAIEYGLIAAGIAAAIILVVNTLGTNLNTTSAAFRPPSNSARMLLPSSEAAPLGGFVHF